MQRVATNNHIQNLKYNNNNEQQAFLTASGKPTSMFNENLYTSLIAANIPWF